MLYFHYKRAENNARLGDKMDSRVIELNERYNRMKNHLQYNQDILRNLINTNRTDTRQFNTIQVKIGHLHKELSMLDIRRIRIVNSIIG